MKPSHGDGGKLSHRRSNTKSSLNGSLEGSEIMDEFDKDEKTRDYYDRTPPDWARAHPGGFERPLVEYCVDEWKTNPNYRVNSDPMDLDYDDYEDESFCEWLCSIFKSRKVRRWLLLSNLLILSLLYIYFGVRPKMAENVMLTESLLMRDQIATGKLSGGLFGNNVRVAFPGMIHMKTLDKKYLPDSHEHKDTGRLVFVGDIHGCREELHALLKEVAFDPKHDHLISTGDMIAKGPDSPGTVDLLMSLGASCVRGNHEDRILLEAKDLESKLVNQNPDNIPGASREEKEAAPPPKWPNEPLAHSLNSSQLTYLASCPVILRIGYLDAFASEVVVVHGGLVPGVPLEDQDPSSVMTMRTIDLHSHVPSPDGKEGPANDGSKKVPKQPWKVAPSKKWPYNVFWTRLWGRWMDMLPKKGAGKHGWDVKRTVVYGHDSKRGLQLGRWSKGLDSGCVSGGRLTALVVADRGRRQYIRQVSCRDHRLKD